jgi:hypothetical protein
MTVAASRRSMSKRKPLIVAAAIAGSFIVLVAGIFALLMAQKITFAAAVLMVVALLAMYIGFGILTALYRLVGKLE